MAAILGGALSAAPTPTFNVTPDADVFALTQPQADALGSPSARYIGVFCLRGGAGQTFHAGDTFHASTLFASTNSDPSIIAF